MVHTMKYIEYAIQELDKGRQAIIVCLDDKQTEKVVKAVFDHIGKDNISKGKQGIEPYFYRSPEHLERHEHLFNKSSNFGGLVLFPRHSFKEKDCWDVDFIFYVIDQNVVDYPI